MKKAEWNAVEAMPEEGALFIDVRSGDDISVSTIRIEGFERIPLEELRSRLSGIDKNRPVYIHCKNGKEGYFASCIMRQEGFNVSNLDGGSLFRECSLCGCGKEVEV